MKKYLKSRRIQVAIVAIFSLLVGWLFLYFNATEVMPQSAIYFLDDVKLPEKGQKVLVFTPHPDDETLGVGGYIAESEEKGAEVRVVLVTDGNKHGLKDQRYKEFQNATSILGVNKSDLVYLNYHDGELKKANRAELADVLQKQIDDYRPNFVLYTSNQDEHPDHATVGEVVQADIARDSNASEIISYQYLIHRSRFPQPRKFRPDYYLVPPTSMISFDNEWKRLMLNSEIENKKREAVEVYRTQLRTPILKSLMMSLIRKNELFISVRNS